MKPAPNRQAGYTIIEVMIFLIISSALILGAVGLFNGRMQRTQFTQAVQAFDTRIKTIANQASTGTSPDAKFNCSTATGEAVIDPVGSTAQGARSDCIFLGKVIAPAATCAAPLDTKNCTSVDVYSVVGRRLNNSNQVSSKLVDPTGTVGAKPRVVLNPDLTETINLGYGTRITGIFQKASPSPSLASGLGFFQSLNGTYNNGNLASGAQAIETWVVRAALSPVSPLSAADMAAAVKAEKLSQPATSGELFVCMKSANGDQKASITINSANGALSTNVVIGDPQCS